MKGILHRSDPRRMDTARVLCRFARWSCPAGFTYSYLERQPQSAALPAAEIIELSWHLNVDQLTCWQGFCANPQLRGEFLTKGFNVKTLATLALAAATAIAAPASATTIALNGGSSWSGWQFLGDSTTDGLWATGSVNRAYDIYKTDFMLDAGQTVTGTKLVGAEANGDGTSFVGNNAADLFLGDWRAGDRVIGYGVQFAPGGDSLFFNIGFDFDNNNKRPASFVGATDGERNGATPGDIAVQISSFDGQLTRYAVFTGPSQGGDNFVRPYEPNGVNLTDVLASPVRSYAIKGAGTTKISSYQFLYNSSAANRASDLIAGFAGGMFGPNTTVRLFETEGSGIDDNSSQVIAAVPEPASWAMLIAGFGLTGAAMRRRRGTPVVTA